MGVILEKIESIMFTADSRALVVCIRVGSGLGYIDNDVEVRIQVCSYTSDIHRHALIDIVT